MVIDQIVYALAANPCALFGAVNFSTRTFEKVSILNSVDLMWIQLHLIASVGMV
jgi:hypothetical protein